MMFGLLLSALLLRAHALVVHESATGAHVADPACTVDPATPSRLRVSDVIVKRLGRDSVVTRDGKHEWIGSLTPPVVGFGMDPQNLTPDTTTRAGGERTEWIQIFGNRYTRFGPPRALPLDLITRIGEVHGASVFVERGLDLRSDPEILYLLTADCLFQPYASPEGSR